MFFGRNRKAEFVIRSTPGAFFLGNLERILLIIPGEEKYFMEMGSAVSF